MQITIIRANQPDSAAVFTLQTYKPPSDECPVCGQRKPSWFSDPASDAAMDSDASPIFAPEVCSDCLNRLLDEGVIAITRIDAESF